MKRSRIVIAGIIFALIAIVAGLRIWVVPGLSVARQEPGAIEVNVATWLLHQSVPDEAKRAVNPIGGDAAEVAAGRDLFQRKCEQCHAYDGGGKSEIGAGLFPRPPALRAINSSEFSDGEIFYHIRNGIRNTGMPSWNLPDRQIWQLVAYIRDLPDVAAMSRSNTDVTQSGGAAPTHYVGSAACKSCHESTYARWSKSRMANVVRDPVEHPDAIIPDLTQPDPLLTFTKADIDLVYGSRWKQRYFKKVGNDYFVYPAQWDVTNKVWRKYFVANGTDWWAALYPPDNFQRPTGPLCDGCHSVNFNTADNSVTEWNVGCERCHGPGGDHAATPTRDNIINPARLDYIQANDTCIQCHSQGQPLTNPIAGRLYDWPVGFRMGLHLSDFWKLEESKPGEQSFTHYADGTAHKNRMQGNDYVNSLMYARGVTCFSCHDSHGRDHEGSLRASANEVCLTCHGPNTQNGPHAASLEQHTHHTSGTPGSNCVDCHMPKMAQTIANVNVRSHTFHFVTPNQTDSLKVPNACTGCHTDKSTAWATAALKTWDGISPWRMTR